MSWLFLLVGAPVLIFGLLYWSGKRFSPAKYARNLAKAMLVAYRAVETSCPGISKEELYLRALMLRPSFSDPSKARAILEDAKETARESKQRVRLWMVALCASMHEYHPFSSRTKDIPGQIPRAIEFYEHFESAVREVIPEDV